MFHVLGNSMMGIIENRCSELPFGSWYYNDICPSCFIKSGGCAHAHLKKTEKIFSNSFLDILRGWEIKEKKLDIVGGKND